MMESNKHVNGLKPVDLEGNPAAPSSIIETTQKPSYPVTVLRTKTNDNFTAKAFLSDGKGGYKEEKFKAGWEFKFYQLHCFDIYGFAEILTTLAKNNHALIIRGQLLPDKDPQGIVQKTFHEYAPTPELPKGQIAYFQSNPNGLPWLMIDIDEVMLPEELNLLIEPLVAVEYCIALLPTYFHNVSYHYQLSSSAGLDGGKKLKVHLSFWLNKPVHDKKLRAWATTLNTHGKLVDASLYNPVQAHFTANPIFNGCPDPFPNNRSGLVKRDHDEVDFPTVALLAPEHSEEANYCYDEHVKGLTPNGKFIYYLEGIGDDAGGLGFHLPIMMAAWSYVVEHGANGTDKEALKLKLKECILKADASAHDASYIAIKLSDHYLDGLISGACAKIGAKGKTSIIEAIQPHYNSGEKLLKDSAQKQLNIVIKSFFDDPRNIALRAPAGIGKTSGIGSHILKHWMAGKKLEFYVPTHALGKQVVKDLYNVPNLPPKNAFLKGVPTGAEWQIIRGREYELSEEEQIELYKGDKFDGMAQCYKTSLVQVLTAKGLPIYPNLCHSGDEKCNYYGNCGYIRQFQGEWDIRVFPHNYLGFDRFFLDSDYPDAAIIDESYYARMLIGVNPLEKGVAISRIQQSCCSDDLKKLLIGTPEGIPLLAYLRKEMGEDQLMEEIHSAIELTNDIKKTAPLVGLPEKDQYKAAKALPERTNVGKFLDVLETELLTGRDNAHGIRINKANSEFRLCYRKPIRRFSGNKKNQGKKTSVLAIDADLNEDVHHQFFDEFEFHEIKTKRNSRVIQCCSTKCSKSSLLSKDTGAKKREEVQKIINKVSKDRNILVIGAQAITGNTTDEDKYPALVSVPDGSELAHFGGIRGIDKYKELDAAVIIGRNQPSPTALETVAGALWYDSDEPLIFDVENLIEEPRGYSTTTGYVAGVNVSVHPDPRIQAVHELIREAESLQALDRLRLIHGKKKDVYLLSNLVLDIDVDHLISWDEMVAGTTLLTEAFNLSGGVLTLNAKSLSKLLPNKLNQASAKNYLNKKVGTSSAAILNSLLVPDVADLRLFQYTVAGSNNIPRKCVSKYDLDVTKERLNKLLGADVTLTKL
jgi:hypothetical protein